MGRGNSGSGLFIGVFWNNVVLGCEIHKINPQNILHTGFWDIGERESLSLFIRIKFDEND